MGAGMRITRPWAFAILLGLAPASCSDTHQDASGGTGAMSDGGGQGGDGGGSEQTGGRPADSGAQALTCAERAALSSEVLGEALEVADVACETRGDCVEISIDTACDARCGALLSNAGRAEVEQVIAELDATTCAGFEQDGCTRLIPPCDPPGEAFCTRGRCSYEQDAVQDAGGPSCIDHTLVWGSDGGLLASRKQFSLEPCATYRVVETSFDGEQEELCENVVAEDGAIAVGAINALLAADDVQDAIAAAPVVFGADSRPLDGVLLRIEIDGAILDVGSPCTMSSPSCADIPPGVGELAEALEVLLVQQNGVSPECLGG